MRFLLVFFLFLSLNSLSWSKGKFETNEMKEPVKMVQTLAQKYGNKNVLIVFDIDNTLLAMKQDFGSDQWFNWQATMIKEKKWDLTAGKSFGDLLKLNAKIFALSPMRLTEKNIPELIKKTQAQGISVIALTSRGPELRNSTERELEKQGIDLTKTSVGNGISETFIPKGHKRLVNFQNGIFMTSGQHKGKMLKFLLDRFKKNYKGIVFVDDHAKHTTSVFKTFGAINDINVYRYGREDANVKRFQKSDKKEVTLKLQKLKKLLKEDFAI